MAKKKLRKLRKGDESKVANTPPHILKQMEDIKKLPDDCFAFLPDKETVEIKLNGEFHNALRLGLEHLMDSQESFRVIRALYRIKHNFVDKKTNKPIPPHMISGFETLMWAVMTLMNTITYAGHVQKKNRVADKTAWWKEFQDAVKVDYRENKNPGVEALDETELANRMGLRVDERTGDLVIDKDYLAQHDLTNPETTHSAEDMLKGRFGIDLEAGDVIDEKLMNPDHYAIPRKRQRGMDGKNEDW